MSFIKSTYLFVASIWRLSDEANSFNRIRITTAPPSASTVEGTLFTACPIVNLVAINTSTNTSGSTQSGDYHIIPISRIQSFQILSLAPALNGADGGCFANAQPPIHALDVRTLKTREINAVAKLQEQEARRGKGVTREAQELFDAFSRTMPARWDGTSIVVADAVVIAKPYRVDDCRSLAAGDSAALTRVRKVVSSVNICSLISYSVSYFSRFLIRPLLAAYSSKWSARRSSFAIRAPQSVIPTILVDKLPQSRLMQV